MLKTLRGGVIGLALLLFAPTAVAQVVSTIKTPPLADSDSIIIPINIHIPAATPPGIGWAGALVQAHILDATEVDIISVHPLPPFAANVLGPPNVLFGPSSPIPSPFGPPSFNVASSPISANFFLPGTATASGIPVLTSSSFTVATALLHAKKTLVANNSDIDISVLLWNIFHLATTAPVHFSTGDQIWTAGTFLISPGTLAGLGSQSGFWVPVTASLTLAGGVSVFFATLAEQTFVGIEHVPEPATGVLLGGGILALGLSRHARRRRLVS